jgi:hypothetical protein
MDIINKNGIQVLNQSNTKYLAFEQRTGTKGQLHSQSKLNTPRHPKRKFDTKTKFKKQKIMLPKDRNLESID